ncbi:MAG: hypothetical protein AVDCRST_MAG67-3183 [uncultured Solirubrobacteraceae bacterium]|uniref:Uncharacterized protein n=1 Tax=uncultured Solirubrobacteraceae bacterium TaxID=1162706 RepID=A0A6J4TAU0_9ACTN|nr:MAG: hypothetical protein AVDCRST_MAG67-3183 [uncultured Solirubrobacteraceae bacterium]
MQKTKPDAAVSSRPACSSRELSTLQRDSYQPHTDHGQQQPDADHWNDPIGNVVNEERRERRQCRDHPGDDDDRRALALTPPGDTHPPEGYQPEQRPEQHDGNGGSVVCADPTQTDNVEDAEQRADCESYLCNSAGTGHRLP